MLQIKFLLFLNTANLNILLSNMLQLRTKLFDEANFHMIYFKFLHLT